MKIFQRDQIVCSTLDLESDLYLTGIYQLSADVSPPAMLGILGTVLNM